MIRWTLSIREGAPSVRHDPVRRPPRARLAVLLREFARIQDDRAPSYVVYPLSEVLLLLTCATICSCDDTKDIAAWGKDHLGFLRRFSEFYHGIPC